MRRAAKGLCFISKYKAFSDNSVHILCKSDGSQELS